jgi:hypothetical protein
MMQPFLSSVTRISSLTGDNFEVAPQPREGWRTGDYVVGRVLRTAGHLKAIELADGRMIEVMEDDLVVGALGEREATLEAVGSWRAVDDTGRFNALTSAGLFGRTTSLSPFLTPPMPLAYSGHVMQNGTRVTMQGAVGKVPQKSFDRPVILIVGTSMSAGKTLSGRQIVHLLTRMGLRVVGAKLTGAARYRDMLSFLDAGAVAVYDFVDAGLPSTVCDGETYRTALANLLSLVEAAEPDVLVAEAGASPLEPYNGEIAKQVLRSHVRFKLLCAQDPYAVVGVMSAFDREPDLVAGGAANTTAGIRLVKKLSGMEAMNLMEPESMVELRNRLSQVLSL